MHRLSLSLTRLESRTVPAVIRVTSLADAGPGSLRAALAEADARPGKDSIIFKLPAPPAHSENVITLTPGELASKGDVTIAGPGAGKLIVSGNGNGRVFHFADGDPAADHPVSITGLSIVSGHTTGAGGGVYSTESLSLAGVTLSGNSAVVGGAVFVNGFAGARSVTVSRSLVVGNTATASAGGLGLGQLASARITASTISGNSAGSNGTGGGLYAGLGDGGTALTVSGCAFINNSAGFAGGLALLAGNGGPTATTTVTGCTVSGNAAAVAGGGMYLTGGRLAVSGCTISANVAATQGGGMAAERFAALTVARTTVTGNVTTQAAAGNGGGGLFVRGDSTGPLDPASISGCKISNNVTPGDGAGALVTGGVRLAVAGSTIAGGVASGSGGGLRATGTGPNQVAVAVSGCTFAGDRATNTGGGLSVDGDGPVSVRATRVSGCASGVGGGVYAHSAAAADGFVMAGCTLSGNVASVGGGLVVANTPAFHVSGSTVANNWASDTGGGILVGNSGGTILGTRVNGNAAATGGGGVVQTGGGTVVLQAGLVTTNTAPTGPDVFGTFTFV